MTYNSHSPGGSCVGAVYEEAHCCCTVVRAMQKQVYQILYERHPPLAKAQITLGKQKVRFVKRGYLSVIGTVLTNTCTPQWGTGRDLLSPAVKILLRC